MAVNQIFLADSWRFCNDWDDAMKNVSYNDAGWRKVTLPHDWSVEGTFSPDALSYCRGGWLPTGHGCYRRRFLLTKGDLEQALSLYFEGIYRNSEVYVNGIYAGGREWGFVPFQIELNPAWIHEGENILVIHADNSARLGCRWYTGSGIYRPVYLESRDKRMCLPKHSLFLQQSVRDGVQYARAEYMVANTGDKRLECTVRHILRDPDGNVVAEEESPHWIGARLTASFAVEFEVKEPRLWELEHPNLYCWETLLFINGKLADRQADRMGFRTIRFDKDKGFFLNGKPCKIKGVCLHNDGGSIGTACSKNTFLRQLEILKTSGCNAIRTAHNPFSAEFLDACDETGFLVLDEIFDEWRYSARVAPVSNGEFSYVMPDYYYKIFDRCAPRDCADIVRRDRNHPSVFMWSVGNENRDMYKYTGGQTVGMLREIVHEHDGTRPVTCAVVTSPIDHANISLLDVFGCNYPDAAAIDAYHRIHSEQPFIITECRSAQPLRPVGFYPADGGLDVLGDYHPGKLSYIRYCEDFMPGIRAWEDVAARPFMMGSFIWTGWDYIGEPTPYDWPAHSSFWGIIDLCGYPKDGYYYYRSVWRPEPLVHIASSWDFMAGDKVTVRILTNCSTVELFRNGKSFGIQARPDGFVWHLDYEPGEITARGRRGAETAEDTVFTSGKPAKIILSQSGPYPAVNGHLYICCEIRDEAGHRARTADTKLRFEVTGGGILQSLDNGYQLSLEPFQNTDTRTVCGGRALCVVRVTGDDPVKVKVSDTAGVLTDTMAEFRR